MQTLKKEEIRKISKGREMDVTTAEAIFIGEYEKCSNLQREEEDLFK